MSSKDFVEKIILFKLNKFYFFLKEKYKTKNEHQPNNQNQDKVDNRVEIEEILPALKYVLEEIYDLIKKAPFHFFFELVKTSIFLLMIKSFLLKCCTFLYNKLFKKISLIKQNDFDVVKELSTTHDFIATMNKYQFSLEKNSNKRDVKENEDILLLLGKEACRKEANKKTKNYGHELRGCCMCKRKLLQLKQLGESLKATECGHVFCLKCTNKLHDKLIHTHFPCPVCAHPLMHENGIVCISNLYL